MTTLTRRRPPAAIKRRPTTSPRPQPYNRWRHLHAQGTNNSTPAATTATATWANNSNVITFAAAQAVFPGGWRFFRVVRHPRGRYIVSVGSDQKSIVISAYPPGCRRDGDRANVARTTRPTRRPSTPLTTAPRPCVLRQWRRLDDPDHRHADSYRQRHTSSYPQRHHHFGRVRVPHWTRRPDFLTTSGGAPLAGMVDASIVGDGVSTAAWATSSPIQGMGCIGHRRLHRPCCPTPLRARTQDANVTASVSTTASGNPYAVRVGAFTLCNDRQWLRFECWRQDDPAIDRASASQRATPSPSRQAEGSVRISALPKASFMPSTRPPID